LNAEDGGEQSRTNPLATCSTNRSIRLLNFYTVETSSVNMSIPLTLAYLC
jgi:hypothetical protein